MYLLGNNTMQKTIKIAAVSLFAMTMSACSTLTIWEGSNKQNERLCANDDGTFYTCQDMLIKNDEPKTHPSLFQTDLHFNRLAEYTEQMAAELQKDVQGIQINEPIAVASFVNLDSSLQNTNALGNQLAESFINDLQQIGLPVNDHKLMGVLNINEKGDFAFSRDIGQLYNESNIGYVLTGTMLKNSRGLVVNARIIDFNTNIVVASSSKFLPNLVVGHYL